MPYVESVSNPEEEYQIALFLATNNSFVFDSQKKSLEFLESRTGQAQPYTQAEAMLWYRKKRGKSRPSAFRRVRRLSQELEGRFYSAIYSPTRKS